MTIFFLNNFLMSEFLWCMQCEEDFGEMNDLSQNTVHLQLALKLRIEWNKSELSAR